MAFIAPRFRLFIKESFAWGVIVYLIFAGYMVFDTIMYAFEPKSGRTSSFQCIQNPPGKTICTVTIYGFWGTSQHSFPADKFGGAWVAPHNTGISALNTFGVSIKVGLQQIDLGYRNQGHDGYYDPELTQKAEEINDLFINKAQPDSKIVIFNGVNPGLHSFLLRRLSLLVAGLLIVIMFATKKRLASNPATSIPVPVRATFGGNVFSWWRINVLIRGFFYLYLFIPIFFSGDFWIAMIGQPLPEYSIFFNCSGLEAFPASLPGYLLSLYPFIAFTTLQAYIQWHYLKQKTSISAWWVATPILALAPVLFVGSATLTCDVCRLFKVLPSGVMALMGLGFSDYVLFKNTVILFGIYSLLLGCIQWSILRRKLNFTAKWILTPLINITIAQLGADFLIYLWSYLFSYYSRVLYPTPPSNTPALVIGGIIYSILLIFLMFILLVGIQDIISGVVIAKILSVNDLDQQKNSRAVIA